MNLPEYEVLIDDKPRKIELIKISENCFTAKTNNKTLKIEVPEKLETGKELTITIDDKTYHIVLPKIEQGKSSSIKIEEASFKTQIADVSLKRVATPFKPTPSTPPRKVAMTKTAASDASVVAPMTGRIASIKVKKGEAVKKEQVLCIIEAMKMENEITATKDGTVSEIHVSEGAPVNEGEALFTID